jgi:hypothetical protein
MHGRGMLGWFHAVRMDLRMALRQPAQKVCGRILTCEIQYGLRRRRPPG